MAVEAIDVLKRVAGGQGGVVTLEQVRSAGLGMDEVRRFCRAGRWLRLSRCAYLICPETSEPALRQARIRAVVASMGPQAVAVLSTAAELFGIGGLRPSDQIHVSLPGVCAKPNRLGEPSVVVHQLVIPRTDTGRVDGIAVTSPLRTVADVILTARRYDGVCVLDSALNQGCIADDDLPALTRMIRGRRGAIAARGVILQADGRAQSPLETRVRLRCVDGGVRPETLQHEVRDARRRLLGIADIAWPMANLLAEADGVGPHGTPEAVFADRRRQNRLVNAGWQILRFTWTDTLNPTYIPNAVRQALHRRPHAG
jgi:very-short-patch-repair endonuclease